MDNYESNNIKINKNQQLHKPDKTVKYFLVALLIFAIVSIIIVVVVAESYKAANPQPTYKIISVEFGVNEYGDNDLTTGIVTIEFENKRNEEIFMFCSVELRDQSTGNLVGSNSHYVIVKANSKNKSAFVVHATYYKNTVEYTTAKVTECRIVDKSIYEP